ncbi:MAG: hypothetical protein NTV77_01240 [Candidatus Azambacteria bacterium]|nr:hypothetical protein [Candidatus Azambacteria bacterium]
MKKIVMAILTAMVVLAVVFLVSSLTGCTIALSPALYTGPSYYPHPPLIVVAPVPVVVGPVTIAPYWRPYYDYGGGYSYYLFYYRGYLYYYYR